MSAAETEAQWFTPEDLAKKLQISTGTIANWRSQKKGPDFKRIGGVVRYSPEAVQTWLDKQPTT